MIHISQDQKLVAAGAALISNKMIDTGSAVLCFLAPRFSIAYSNKYSTFLTLFDPRRIPYPPVSVFPITSALLPQMMLFLGTWLHSAGVLCAADPTSQVDGTRCCGPLHHIRVARVGYPTPTTPSWRPIVAVGGVATTYVLVNVAYVGVAAISARRISQTLG